MSAASAKHHVEQMIRMECRGWGDQVPALARICRRYGLSTTTLDNIRTGRAKRIFCDVRDSIRLAYLDMCKREVAKWKAELAAERAQGHIDADLEAMEREADDLAAKIAARLARIESGR